MDDRDQSSRGAGQSEPNRLEASYDADIEFLLGADERYFPGLVVAVLSTLHSLNRDRIPRFHVIDGGIGAESRQVLLKAFSELASRNNQKADLVFTHVDLEQFDRFPKIWGYSAMTYARILAPSLVDADRIIWVDSDMIVFKDLSAIQGELDGSNCLIAGSRDPAQTMESDCPAGVDISGFTDDPYLNCGLLWMNLKRMRDEKFSETLIRKMDDWKESLQFWDQTALNCAALGQKYPLARSYNEFTNKTTSAGLVALVGEANLHMVMGEKPWLGEARYRQGVRDTIFYRTYSLLTGRDSERELNAIEKRFYWRLFSIGFLKTCIYRITGNREKFEKWKRRSMLLHEYRRLKREIGIRLTRWYER